MRILSTFSLASTSFYFGHSDSIRDIFKVVLIYVFLMIKDVELFFFLSLMFLSHLHFIFGEFALDMPLH